MALSMEELTHENEILAEKLGTQAEDAMSQMEVIKTSLESLRDDIESEGADALSKIDAFGPLLDQLDAVIQEKYDETLASLRQGISNVDRNRATLDTVLKGVGNAMKDAEKKADTAGDKFDKDIDKSEDKLKAMAKTFKKASKDVVDNLDDSLDSEVKDLEKSIEELDSACEILNDSRQDSFEDTFTDLVEPIAEEFLSGAYFNAMDKLSDEVGQRPEFDVDAKAQEVESASGEVAASFVARQTSVTDKIGTLATTSVGAVDGPLEEFSGVLDTLRPMAETFEQIEGTLTGFVEDIIEM